MPRRPPPSPAHAPHDVDPFAPTTAASAWPTPPAPPPQATAPRPGGRRPEAVLEREILRRFGQVPDLLVCKNEVGTGFTRGVMDEVLRALPACFHAEIAAIFRKWAITWGLGVGSPDLVGAVAGAALFVELKAEDGVVSEAQRIWHAASARRGAPVDIVRSEADMERAIERARARAGGGRGY